MKLCLLKILNKFIPKAWSINVPKVKQFVNGKFGVGKNNEWLYRIKIEWNEWPLCSELYPFLCWLLESEEQEHQHQHQHQRLCSEERTKVMAGPSVHPIEAPPLTVTEHARPRQSLKDTQGMPGTLGGFILRFLQFSFALLSLSVIASTSDFPSVTAFRYPFLCSLSTEFQQ